MKQKELARKITAILERGHSLSQIDKDLLIRMMQDLYEIVIDLPVGTSSTEDSLTIPSDVSEVEEEVVNAKLDLEANSIYEEAEKSFAHESQQTELPHINESTESQYSQEPAPHIHQNEEEQEFIHTAPVVTNIEPQSEQNNTPPLQTQVPTPAPANNTWTEEVHEINQELEDLFEVSQSNDLFGKLASTPIQNLKQSIGINDRLLFTKVLFNGKDTDYQSLINELNELTSINKAKQILYPIMQANEWNASRKEGIARSFLQIVKRRYA